MLTTFDTILRQLVDVLSTLPDLAYKWIATIALFGVVILVKRAIDRRLMGKTETLTPVQRQWIHSNRTMSRLALLIVVLTIWLPSLSSIAFPLTAVAVALVIATKELIVCVLGTWFRIVNKPFAVGDWIELDRSIRGEILDFGILATKLLEMDIPENPYGYTGNIITLPNSVFLTNRVFNLTRQKKVTFHTFIITLGFIHETPPRAKALQDIIDELMAPHTKDVRDHLRTYRQHFKTDVRLPNPQVQIRTTEFGNLQYYITLCCPTADAIHLEQELSERIISLHYPQ